MWYDMWIKIKAILNCLYRHVSCVFVLTYFYTVDCIKVSILYSMLLNQNIFFLILLCQYLELLAWKKNPKNSKYKHIEYTYMYYMHICNGIFVAVSYFSHRLQALFYNIYDKSCMQINAHSLTEYIYFYFYSILFFFWSTYIYNYKNVAGLCHRKRK